MLQAVYLAAPETGWAGLAIRPLSLASSFKLSKETAKTPHVQSIIGSHSPSSTSAFVAGCHPDAKNTIIALSRNRARMYRRLR